MKIKNFSISNFGNTEKKAFNVDKNIVFLNQQNELLTVLKWFMNIDLLNSIKEMDKRLTPNSYIQIDFEDNSKNLINFTGFMKDNTFKRAFSICNFKTSNFLTEAFFQHFFPCEYSDYAFLDIDKSYSNILIKNFVNKLTKTTKNCKPLGITDDRPPHSKNSAQVLEFINNYVENFIPIKINETQFFTINSNHEFIFIDKLNKRLRLNKSNTKLFNLLCFIFTNDFFSAIQKFDEELESANSPLLINGSIEDLSTNTDFILDLLQKQNRQIYILN